MAWGFALLVTLVTTAVVYRLNQLSPGDEALAGLYIAPLALILVGLRQFLASLLVVTAVAIVASKADATFVSISACYALVGIVASAFKDRIELRRRSQSQSILASLKSYREATASAGILVVVMTGSGYWLYANRVALHALGIMERIPPGPFRGMDEDSAVSMMDSAGKESWVRLTKSLQSTLQSRVKNGPASQSERVKLKSGVEFDLSFFRGGNSEVTVIGIPVASAAGQQRMEAYLDSGSDDAEVDYFEHTKPADLN